MLDLFGGRKPLFFQRGEFGLEFVLLAPELRDLGSLRARVQRRIGKPGIEFRQPLLQLGDLRVEFLHCVAQRLEAFALSCASGVGAGEWLV